jgi:hypothetical protein
MACKTAYASSRPVCLSAFWLSLEEIKLFLCIFEIKQITKRKEKLNQPFDNERLTPAHNIGCIKYWHAG